LESVDGMSRYSKAKMFNRKAGRKSSKADEILRTLNVQPGQIVADVGAGGGFFSFLFSYAVGQSGTVYAIDINKDFLEYIDIQAREKGRLNIQMVLATEQSIPLSKHSIDLMFVRNVYHHLSNRISYFAAAKELLRPQAIVIIIEYTRQGSRLSFHRRCDHNVPKEIIVDEMRKAGYTVAVSFDFLPVQSFTIFTPVER
jgi:ubiquinone/menaquinone biosynthesis C-methylase UbiE